MFHKNSRYYKLENTTKIDATGRVIESKALRLLPDVSGQFQHIVEGSDRLDNLAYKYYKNPRQWWRLCDANPEFTSPRALLGKEPTKTTRFDLQWDGLQAPWYLLCEEITQQIGVDKVLLGSETQPYPDESVFDVGFLFSMNISLEPDISASILSQSLAVDLDAAFQAEGHVLDADIHIAGVEPNHWRLLEKATGAIYTIRSQAGVLNVFESVKRFNWSVTVIYNERNISSETLSQVIEDISTPGFAVISPVELRRVGKPIIVPPRTTGK